MPVLHLPSEAIGRIHPVHHIVHLFRRQDVLVGMSENKLGHIMNAHDMAVVSLYDVKLFHFAMGLFKYLYGLVNIIRTYDDVCCLAI